MDLSICISFLNSRGFAHARGFNYLMMSKIISSLRDAILHQNIHDCFEIPQDPKLELKSLLHPNHKEWYFVVLENALPKITLRLDFNSDNADTVLAQTLEVSVKLANTYARRELLLDYSIEKINSAIQKDDAKISISVLLQQNENLGGIFEKLLGSVSADDCDKSTKWQLRTQFIHDELKCAVTKKDEALNYEEILTVLQELHRVIVLDEAVINRNERKVMQILSSKDSLWENVSHSLVKSGATYLCELANAKAAKKNETGGS